MKKLFFLIIVSSISLCMAMERAPLAKPAEKPRIQSLERPPLKSFEQLLQELPANKSKAVAELEKESVRSNPELLSKTLRQVAEENNANARLSNGQTPLMIATQYGSMEDIKTLLAKKADPYLKDKDGKSSLIYAIPRIHILKLLLKDVDIDKEEITLVIEATKAALIGNKNASLTEYKKYVDFSKNLGEFVRAGSNKPAEETSGQNMGYMEQLEKAYVSGNKEQLHNALVRIANRGGSAINRTMKLGNTPLIIAIQAGTLDDIKLLLASGARIDFSDDRGNTPLMDAVRGRNPEVMELLLANHANLNAQNASGYTPLHFAKIGLQSAKVHKNPELQKEYQDVFDSLTKKGAKTDLKNAYGETPLDVVSTYSELHTGK